MKNRPFTLKSSYAYQAYVLARALRKDFFKIAKRAGYDLFPEQWFALYFIVNCPGQTQSELAAHAFEDRSSLSRTLKSMSSKSLITSKKDEVDLRAVRYWPTQSGINLYESIVDTMRGEQNRVFANLSDADHREFSRIVKILMQNMD